MSVPSLSEVVEVVDTETVVRLDGRPGRLAELVLTGDVAASLGALLHSACGESGGGFFVVGPFGSGKSHFLAALGELLEDPEHSARAVAGAPGWTAELRDLVAKARASLPVPVPLVDYRAEARLEDVVAARAWSALGRPAPAEAGTDRLAAWDELLRATAGGGRRGLLLLLDELSELLRAKQGPALVEDLRFLQFLGEWAGSRPVLVVAALQESIEEVANVSQRELGRIRDRYHPSLTLSMRHVEDLVRGRLVRLRPGAEEWVAKAHAEVAAAFPASVFDPATFARCYPLHPETLHVLEGLRFLLSQQRGVVDFVCTTLRARLERPCTELVTPDLVYDHFAGRLNERPETARLAGTVVPYYERALGELVDADDRELALRTVKLLVLLAASPLERPRTAGELAGMLLYKVSDVDPSANVSYLEAAVLRPAVERGAYVVVHPGSPPAYSVDAGADAALVLAGRVAQARAELNPADRHLVATLFALGSTPSLPLQMLGELGASRRELLWHNTLRSIVVGTGRLCELSAEEVHELVERARAAGAEGYLLVAEPELTSGDVAEAAAVAQAAVGAAGRLAVWLPAPLSPADHDALLDLHAHRKVALDAEREGHPELVEASQRTTEGDQALAREILRRTYFDGKVLYPPGDDGLFDAPGADLPSLAGLAFERQLPRLADPLLARVHPQHAAIAPRGELVGERILRRLVHEAIPAGRIPPSALSQLRPLVEGYLVPLGLARTRKDGATVAPDPARSPAVAEVLRLVGNGEPVPAAGVVAALAEGPLGLTEPESLLVLNACVRVGLVEMVRGRARLTEPFLAVTPADRLLAGELVEPAVREVVARLGPIVGPGPFDPWSAVTQRQAWQYAQAWLEARREELAQVAAGLEAADGIPVLGGADTTGVRRDMETVGAVLEAVPTGTAATEGLRALAAAVEGVVGGGGARDGGVGGVLGGGGAGGVAEGADALLAASRRLARVARFFRDDLRRVEDAAAYLTHPDFRVPEDAGAPEELRGLEASGGLGGTGGLPGLGRTGGLPGLGRARGSGGLGGLRESTLALLAGSLELAAEDRVGELFAAVGELRSAYLAAYQEAHDRYYAAGGPAAVAAVHEAPEYQALAALSEIGAVAVPDDRVKVDRALAAAAPPPCTRRVDQELRWQPICSCGLRLDDPVPVVDRAALVALAGRGVAEHLAELARPDQRARLLDAATDLEALGRQELASDLRRLVEVASDGTAGGTAAGALITLLGPELRRTVHDVLAGSQLIVTRDLAALREDVIGRRYPKRRLLDVLAAWVDPAGDMAPGGFVEVVDSADPRAGRGVAGTSPPGTSPPGTSPPGTGGNGSGGSGSERDRIEQVGGRGSGGFGVGVDQGRAGGFGNGESHAGGVEAGGGHGLAGAAWEAHRLAVDSQARRSHAGDGGRGATVAFLRARWPTVAEQLPATQAADAFWLATWWAGRPDPPAWLPAGLLADRRRLAEAALAALDDSGAIADLEDLDRRITSGTVLGEHVAKVLDLEGASASEVLRALTTESLLRHPVRLAIDALLRRLAGDWQLLERIGRPDPGAIAAGHALVAETEVAALLPLTEAAGHLAQLERQLPFASATELVEELYPRHGAPVPRLLSLAEVASAGSLVDTAAVEQVRSAAARLLGAADDLLRRHADAGFPDCMAVWDIGRAVIAPLLDAYGRVAVLLVDALRADLADDVAAGLSRALPGRRIVRRWAVVPSPTRTAESVTALATGRAVPAGSTVPVPPGNLGEAAVSGGTVAGGNRQPGGYPPSQLPAPFAHLGHETKVLMGADRDHHAADLRLLWSDGPPLSIAVATAIDERLHRTSVELAGLLDEARAGIERRVLPSLSTLPADVPLVVLSDHGFRENPSWGRGPEGRYTHGGTSLEECVIPVLVATPAEGTR